ncbi:alanine--tRNA ligase [Candidatus Purcelliella pentastirinorum]|uniref:alanine--tRNA ligase n=1 Tax=Candidatus Purcelliella pentastirinorum TaxID=472834 RepID=UPI0023677553|nr:alanine--tRNA ligase [Candidatus Purcelliella pentastirinorum]WDI79052.1 alanine--tRNA ligase [Candidatus Purcelliella pentastirinorum]WDR80190.1 alanine--tRNA ligase [Candidatus Purcelliella pentastirinorum]
MKFNITNVRRIFLDFFKNNGHKIFSCGSLISSENTSLLFTNAGMNQFKDYYLGYKKSNFSRIVTSQHCLRVGGKHNDFEKIGYTNFHNTFFEMLGNFSFDDYFKKEAIFYAWELLTGTNNFNLPKDRLLVTVHYQDYESYKIWSEDICIKSDRIIVIGNNENNGCFSDNFWQMDNIGPCGPCTEIFYDNSTNPSDKITDSNIIYSERFIEIWNIVFIQFNRDINGSLIPLKIPLVDTGMGLERIVSVLQNVYSVYEIDLFNNMIVFIADLIKCNDLINTSFRVISDHIRSCIFIIQDGILPSNEKHGYILRKLIRRSIIHGYMLGVRHSFLYKLVNYFVHCLKLNNYLIKLDVNSISSIIKSEEDHFSKTLQKGFLLLNKKLINLKTNVLDGKTLFELYDTYGFPIYLTKEICLKNNILINFVEYEDCMSKQRKRSRMHNDDTVKLKFSNLILSNYSSVFNGYVNFEITSKILLILKSNKMVKDIFIGQMSVIVLDETSFFFESSGQISDIGILKNDNGIFRVDKVKKYGNIIFHIGVLISGHLSLFDVVCSSIDRIHRKCIEINHSSTHLLHSALRTVLGEHVVQKGSFINHKYFRFDFFHKKSLTTDELSLVENIVNNYIRDNVSISTTYMNLNDIKLNNIIFLFNEKYQQEFMRVVKIGDISSEVCLGTHVKRTGDIGLLKLISDKGVSLGVRRIESITGRYAISYIQSLHSKINLFSKLLNSSFDNLENNLISTIKNLNLLKKFSEKSKKDDLDKNVIFLKKNIEVFKGVNFLFNYLLNLDINNLYKIMCVLIKTLNKIIIFLFTNIKDDYFFIFYISENLDYLFDKKDLINFLSDKVNCKIYFNSNIGNFRIKNNYFTDEFANEIKYWIFDKL